MTLSTTRLKYVAEVVAGQSPDSSTVSRRTDGLPFIQGNAEFGEMNPTARLQCSSPPKLATRGDLLLSVRAPVGALNVADRTYGIGRGLNAIRPRSVDARFLYWLVREAKSYLDSIATGSTFAAVSASDVGSITVPAIPKSMQRLIGGYLDTQTAKIDTLIGKQERLIETLAERRRAVISHAVTKGLDPNVPMTESGVDWLGEVPLGWAVQKLGRIINALTGFPFKSDDYSDDETDIRLLRGVNVNPGALVWEEVVFWPRTDESLYSHYLLRQGDLILGLDRPIVSSGTRVARVSSDDLPALLLQRVARIRPTGQNEVGFLEYLLSGPEFRDYLAPIFTGVSVPHMSPDQLSSFRVAMPDSTEQRKIVEYLNYETSKIHALTAKAREIVEVLKERRQALISAVVTGKIDVRGLT